MSNYPYFPWWLTPPWEEPEQENTMTPKQILEQELRDIISELENALDELENGYVDNCIDELTNQSGTITTMLETYENG